MKIVFGVLVSLVCVHAFGAEVSQMNAASISQASPWSVEGVFNTISNSTSSTFGPTLLYDFDSVNFLGVRVLAPTSNGNGTYSEFAVYRHSFRPEKTSLFAEITAGENQYSYSGYMTDAPSAGTNIGIIHHLNQDIAFGGLAGLEWTQALLEKYYAMTSDSHYYVYGRLGIFGSIAF